MNPRAQILLHPIMASQKRSRDFRPDPQRAIYLSGAIDQSTLDRLTPEILRLQALNREPVTLFIDSPGGITFFADRPQQLLTVPDLDSALPCRLITVATGFAASAASDLLMAGDYALAYPHSTILCHGVRQDQSNVLTHERAVTLAKNLALSNEQYALMLARNSISRLIFRIVSLRSGFPSIRAQNSSVTFNDASCFIYAVRDRLPEHLTNLMRDAQVQSLENDILDLKVSNHFQQLGDPTNLRIAAFEAHILKVILDNELDEHKEHDWSFRTGGLERIEARLVLLVDKLSTEEETELRNITEELRAEWLFEKVERHLRPIWFFFVSICRLLQEDDYYLSAEEAYWLGLIDEVIGRPDLPSPRILVEHAPEPVE